MKAIYSAWKDKKVKYEAEKIAQGFFRKIGFNVTRTKFGNYEDPPIKKLLGMHKINFVLDIGANKGQYADNLLRQGYQGTVISFEPQTTAHEALCEKAKAYPNWKVAPRCAIGERDGDIEINISKNSVSSSILKIKPGHLEAEPSAGFARTEKTRLFKLDTIAPQYINNDSRIFAKIDVQGYQEQVLRGAKKILQKTLGMQLECSLLQLYEGESDFIEMLRKAKKQGFELQDIIPGFRNNRTGRLLQADCIFFRP